jgi:hypothetical protein
MLLPSPRTSDTNGAGHHGDGGMDLRTAVAEIPLLPTPAVNDMGAAYTPEQWDEWTATMKAKHNNGNGHGKSLIVEAQPLSLDIEGTLLPTPSVADSTGGHERRGGERGEELLLKGVARAAAEGTLLPTPAARDSKGYGPADLERHDPNLSALPLLLPTPTATDSKSSGASGYDSGHDGTTLTDATVRQPAKWGEYEPAIRRQEAAFGRPAPEPTKLNAKGNPKLSDEFDEWLMGLPAGWITDVPDITWNETLKACGNGVVPPQAVAALLFLRAMGRWSA